MFIRNGSSGNGVNGQSSHGSYVGYTNGPSIDLSAAYKFSDSQWSMRGYGSYFNARSHAERRGTGGDQQILAYSLSTPTIPQNIKAEFEVLRTRAGLDANYAFIDARKSRFAADVGIAASSLDVENDIRSFGTNVNIVKNDMSFFGIGPRFGFSGSHVIGKGFGVKGGLGVSVLLGQGSIDQHQTTANERVREDQLQAVPMAELQVAATYDRKIGGFLVGSELGLKVEHWANLPDWYAGTHSAQVNPYKAGNDSITFAGPYFNLTASF